MKTLILFRHAKSSWDFPELSDFERPLNVRGNKNAPEMGKRMRKRNLLPELVLSSPAERAITTAKLVASEIGYPSNKIVQDKEIYHASPRTMLAILSKLDAGLDSVMLFGHNPGLTEFSNMLTDDYIENIPTSGVVAIEFKITSWSQLKNKKGKILFFDYPKNKK